jgi:hypothetical protein
MDFADSQRVTLSIQPPPWQTGRSFQSHKSHNPAWAGLHKFPLFSPD